ncbi:hypothetical protein FB45DRAFT_865844 [Roridomyces roridus]|uniref:AB hydrolase-1 domain-containing protein n=1 Tax=Roridomyces roridus TaxID=1738132 RepID=A0AAD7C080_9AGAR|nr:hypothetical protein FB45DRAFT_865844 [Roridomyces roridus]
MARGLTARIRWFPSTTTTTLQGLGARLIVDCAQSGLHGDDVAYRMHRDAMRRLPARPFEAVECRATPRDCERMNRTKQDRFVRKASDGQRAQSTQNADLSGNVRGHTAAEWTGSARWGHTDSKAIVQELIGRRVSARGGRCVHRGALDRHPDIPMSTVDGGQGLKTSRCLSTPEESEDVGQNICPHGNGSLSVFARSGNPFPVGTYCDAQLTSKRFRKLRTSLVAYKANPRPGRQNGTIRWVDCHENVSQPLQSTLNVTGTSFAGTLPKTLFCGEIDVPMDYTRPFDSATNNITVGFAMNRPRNPAELLLYHAGGPGLDAASEAWFTALNISSDSAPFNLLQDFDLLGASYTLILFPAMNTRGLQFSNPLNCSFNTFFNNITFAFPSTEAEFDQYHAAMSKLFVSCGENSTPKGIMNHTGTVEVVQDWDSIRAALGYEKVHFAGVSYGTFVSMEYIARFPERVSNFALDAAIPHGTGNGSVVAAWDTLLARALEAPIPAASCGEGKGCNTPVTPTDLRLGVSVIFRANPDFPLFNIALNESLHGDASLFAYQQQGDIRESIVTLLLCVDSPNRVDHLCMGADTKSLLLVPPPITPVQSIEVDFIRTGILPGTSANAQVTVYTPGSTRGPIPGAYDVPTGSFAEDTSSMENIHIILGSGSASWLSVGLRTRTVHDGSTAARQRVPVPTRRGPTKNFDGTVRNGPYAVKTRQKSAVMAVERVR